MGFLGLGNRKRYNIAVDAVMKGTLLIETNSRFNPNFGGAWIYLEMIDPSWQAGRTAEAAAILIGMSYYCGLMKSGVDKNRAEAGELRPRLVALIAQCLADGRIEPWMAANVKVEMDKVNATLNAA